MPELPDLTVYIDALRERVLGQPLVGVRVLSPFLLRTFDPPVESVVGQPVVDISRLGKRIVLELAAEATAGPDSVFLALHLMIAGRLRWLPAAAGETARTPARRRPEKSRASRGGPKTTPVRPPAKITLATLDFPSGTLAITEGSTRKRASLHVIRGRHALAQLDPGGLEVLAADAGQFAAVLRRENRTLKRALTDPRLFAGIGNAYSDEILHAARLSPVTLTARLDAADVDRLFHATQATLRQWIDRLRRDFTVQSPGAHSIRFPGPGEITAFRPDFAVHGRFGQPCPACGMRVQRIRYAENEANYCPTCQTGGRVLADRSLSRLLRDDWPRRAEEWNSE